MHWQGVWILVAGYFEYIGRINMGTLKYIGFVFLIVASNYSFAATEFEDSIPVDVVKALFSASATGRLEIYSDIMDEFPAFQLTVGFSVIGSVNHNSRLRGTFETQVD